MIVKYKINLVPIGVALTIAGGIYFTGIPAVEHGRVIGITSAYAQDKDEQKPRRRTRRVETMGLKAVATMNDVRDEVDVENFSKAFEIVNDFLGSRAARNLNSAEIAGIYTSRAYLQYELKDTPGAIKSYEKVLEIDEERLSRQQRMNTLYTVAQLNFSLGEYQESIKYLKQWFQMAEQPGSVIKPKARQHVFFGQVYYSVQDFDSAIPHIITAIEMTKAAGGEVKENWYGILRSMYYEKKEIRKAKEIVEILAVEYTKPNYWLELASIYSQLGEDMKQLAVMEVAYNAGYFDKPNQIINLAQIYRFQGVPYKAAKVMAKALADGSVEKDADNYKLYSESLVMAQELDDAIEPLKIAADLADDGELYIRLAGVYAERDKWQQCIDAVGAALDKGVKREDIAYILRGMANFNIERFDAAIEDFREARRDDRSKDTARKWISYLTREKVRLAELAKATRQ